MYFFSTMSKVCMVLYKTMQKITSNNNKISVSFKNFKVLGKTHKSIFQCITSNGHYGGGGGGVGSGHYGI